MLQNILKKQEDSFHIAQCFLGVIWLNIESTFTETVLSLLCTHFACFSLNKLQINYSNKSTKSLNLLLTANEILILLCQK